MPENRTNEEMQMLVDTNYKDYNAYEPIIDVAVLLHRLKAMRQLATSGILMFTVMSVGFFVLLWQAAHP